MPHDDGGPVVFDLPKQEGQKRIHQVAYILTGDLLAASDDSEVLQSIVAAMKDGRKDSLASVKSFSGIMARCAESAGSTQPHVRWFVDPFGYIEMVRSVTVRERRRGIDIFQALKNQGFTAVQGVGGFVNFSADKCELIHRTMVWAPPLPGHESSHDKYDLAARMLNFPVGSDLEPQVWVPKQVATYTSFNLDIKTAFAASETLVDEVMAEKGVFHDVLDSLKNDPDGPKVDIVKDLVGNLGNRVTIITDYELPIGPKSERLLVAVEGTNEKVLADTIEKTMKGDAVRREFEGHVIWEITDERRCRARCEDRKPERRRPRRPSRRRRAAIRRQAFQRRPSDSDQFGDDGGLRAFVRRLAHEVSREGVASGSRAGRPGQVRRFSLDRRSSENARRRTDQLPLVLADR